MRSWFNIMKRILYIIYELADNGYKMKELLEIIFEWLMEQLVFLDQIPQLLV